MSLVLLIAATAALGRVAGHLLPLGKGVEGLSNRAAAGLLGCGMLAAMAGLQSILFAQVALLGLVALGLIAEAAPRVYAGAGRRRRKRPATVVKASALPNAPPTHAPRSWFEWVCLILVVLAGGMAFLGCWAPASDPLATSETLALAKYYSITKHMHFAPDIEGAAAPHLAYALYTVAWNGSGERPAALLGWMASMLSCAALFGLGKRMAGPKAGMAAAAVFAAAPVFYDQAATASLFSFQMLFTLAALSAVYAWHDEGDAGRLFFAGLMAGAAWGVGHAGAVMVLLLPLVVLAGTGPAMAEAYRGDRTRGMCLVLAVSMATAAPFMARTWLFTGDPFYPWLQAWFPARAGDHPVISYFAWAPLWMEQGFDWIKALRYPWDVVMRPGAFDGWWHSPGGLIIALGLPGLLLCGRRAWLTAFLAVPGVFVLLAFQPGALPALAFFALMMAVSGAAVVALPGAGRWLATSVLLFCVLFGLGMHALRLRESLQVLLGQETREGYLARQVPGYSAWAAVNDQLAKTPGIRVLSADNGVYFADSPVYANRAGLRRVAGLNAAERLDWLRDKRINLLLIPDRLLETGSPLPAVTQAMLQHWRNTPAFFPLLERLDLPRLHGEGAESVSLYAVKLQP